MPFPDSTPDGAGPAGPADGVLPAPDEGRRRPGWRAIPGRVARRLHAWWRLGLSKWRRSLQVRTVASSALLSGLALLAIGLFLSNQIAAGLFQERFRQLESESVRALSTVKSNFESAATTDRSSTVTLVNDTLRLVEGDGTSVQRDFLLMPLPSSENIYVGTTSSRATLTPRVIPEELSEAVQAGGGVHWQSIALPGEGADRPGLAFGTKVTLPPGREYALYLVYDLSPVQESLAFIHRVMGIAGALLLIVNGGIAWYVTRSVVRPVSSAADISEKFAAGHLEERMQVRGEDEIARLGTSFNRMAASLQEQITQLAALSMMQQRFVSDVSHELRTPLTTVRMAAEVLHDAREGFDPVNRRSAELLYNQVERFQTLLNDLLEISRFDAGVAVLEAEPADLVPVVRRAVEAAQPHADLLGSAIRIHNEAGTAIADMDPRRIERVVRNLVMNAIEHGEGKPIDIAIGADGQGVAVTVRDHGIGMSPESASRVFDRFWRADPARARTTGGSGLGLSIATEDTRLHSGWLQAWGEPGEGSCFRLTLPRHRGDTLSASPLPLAQAGPAPSEVPPATGVIPVVPMPQVPDRAGAATEGEPDD